MALDPYNGLTLERTNDTLDLNHPHEKENSLVHPEGQIGTQTFSQPSLFCFYIDVEVGKDLV